MFSSVNVEDRIAWDHPLRQIGLLVKDTLKALDGDFSELYAPRYRLAFDRAGASVAGDVAAGDLFDPV